MSLSTSSIDYFRFLLNLNPIVDTGYVNTASDATVPEQWYIDLMEGYITSADTGSEDLVRASRAALAETLPRLQHSHITSALIEIMKRNMANDRLLVSAMEVFSFLLDVGVLDPAL